jgi:hypothetical protein
VASVFIEGVVMIQTVEAMIDQNGQVYLPEGMKLPASRRAIVMILDEEPKIAEFEPGVVISETALLSEQSLAKDWNRLEEDAAWSYLQSAQ